MSLTGDADELLAWSYDKVGDSLRTTTDMRTAAAELEWDLQRAGAALTYLHRTGFLKIEGIGGVYSISVQGIDAMEKAAGSNVERWVDRWAFLRLSYTEAGGRLDVILNMWEMGEKLGWDRGRTERVLLYLTHKGLLGRGTLGGGYTITEYCFDLIERAEARPDSPTGDVPPLSSLQVHITNSTVVASAIGSPGATVTSGDISVHVQAGTDIGELLDELLGHLKRDGQVDRVRLIDIEQDVACLKAQLAKSQPDKGLVRSLWDSLKATAGPALATVSVQYAFKAIEAHLQ